MGETDRRTDRGTDEHDVSAFKKEKKKDTKEKKKEMKEKEEMIEFSRLFTSQF